MSDKIQRRDALLTTLELGARPKLVFDASPQMIAGAILLAKDTDEASVAAMLRKKFRAFLRHEGYMTREET